MTQPQNRSVSFVRTLGRLLIVTAAASLLPRVAAARDSDADGVADHVDAYPCDPTSVAAAFAPAEKAHGMLMFEDRWPDDGDLDFNDTVVTYNYAFLLATDDGSDAATSPVKSIQISYNVLARGAGLQNGIGLRLPVAASAAAGATITRNFDDGVLTPLTPVASESQLVLDVVHDTSAIVERANNDPGQPVGAAVSFTVLIDFERPVRLDLSQAPFDVFLFRSDDFSHQIHQSRYRGTDTMNTALFGTGDDGSTGCASAGGTPHCFVNKRGLPFALNVPSSVAWMLETHSIDTAYPDIVGFAASGGTQNSDWYRTNVDATLLYKGSEDGTEPPVPRVLGPGLPHADTSCVPERTDVEFGSTSYDWAYDAASAKDGSTFVAGYSSGVMPKQLDPSTTNAGFVTKVDSSGEVAWSYRTVNTAESVAVDGAGNAYVLDYDGSSNQVLKKLSPSGTVLWSTVVRTSGGNGWLNKVAASDDAVYVAGYEYTYSGYDSWYYYYYYYSYAPRLIKVGSDGSITWANTYAGNTYDYDIPQSLSVDAQGNALLASNARSWSDSNQRARLLQVAADGTQVAQSFLPGHDYLYLYDVALASDGSVGSVGYYQDRVSCSYYDYYYYYYYCNYDYSTFTARYDANWQELWSHKATPLATSSAQFNHVAVDSQGAVLSSGTYSGVLQGESKAPVSGTGVFAAKYLPTGDLAWLQSVNEVDDPRYHYEAALSVDGSDQAYVTGSFYTADWSNADIYVVGVGDGK